MLKSVSRIRINGLRGAALLVAAVYCATRGIAYLPPLIPNASYVPGSLSLIANFVPLPVWGGVWILVALFCLVCAFRHDDWPAWAGLVGMMVLWGSSYLIGSFITWAAGDFGREWIGAGSYLGPAVIIAILSPKIPDRMK
ncbi:hypothetical protein B7R22_17245 [Subtercola boreus]|uniref:Uncharacterized protein n=1 Tax=Subtercola boreus TaxID=120213 RepID=A0A3E0VQA2_9MICO|nr:hypothetical protein [Subtercola boreus]RFA12174.1 hypothetical protein B7R22_17245 [Subtercola boreus]